MLPTRNTGSLGHVPVHTICWHEANRGYLHGVPRSGGPSALATTSRCRFPQPVARGLSGIPSQVSRSPGLDRPTQAEPSLIGVPVHTNVGTWQIPPESSLAQASRGLRKVPWTAGLLPHRSHDSAACSQPGGHGSPLAVDLPTGRRPGEGRGTWHGPRQRCRVKGQGKG